VSRAGGAGTKTSKATKMIFRKLQRPAEVGIHVAARNYCELVAAHRPPKEVFVIFAGFVIFVNAVGA
jgi:hypothetical protein